MLLEDSGILKCEFAHRGKVGEKMAASFHVP